MPRPMTFRALSQKLLDNWIQTDPERPTRPEIIYAGAVEHMSPTMRLTVYHTDPGDPMDWFLEAIRHLTIPVSASVDFRKFFESKRIRDFEDQNYIRSVVFPAVPEVYASGQHRIEYVRTQVLGNEIGYDRLLLPQKSKGPPSWIISFVEAGYLLNKPITPTTPDAEDRVLVQLLAEGNSAKEIAKYLDVSHRTVEHRLERMKERFGARNIPHLVAMVIGGQASQAGDKPS